MDIEALSRSPVGQLVPISVPPRDLTADPSGYFAFLPNPLPENFDDLLDARTWSAAGDASAALGALNQVCAQLPNPRLLITPALFKEAQSTSALEGTYGTLSEVMEARLPGAKPRSDEAREINAYVDMAYQAFAWIRERERAQVGPKPVL